MANNYFKFKQFTIFQDKCAMKVGTDGTLLGAWACGGGEILDIGTGTGLVALMMAQRFRNADIVALDIDWLACVQAVQNISGSPFSERINVLHNSVQNFADEWQEDKFDSIVCNPPYFVNSLGCPNSQRHIARHTTTLNFHDLFGAVSRLLAVEGLFSVIIPADSLSEFDAAARITGFRCKRRCLVKTVQRKPAKRVMLEYTLDDIGDCQEEEHSLLDNQGQKSEWYSKLTCDFYL